ncbi:MAG: SDR family NAD(P)-dependent oxidoreductase, partial [Gammaproteobacteria bacterium]
TYTTPESTQQEQPVFLQEPIAIIGMACRFPGQANTPEAFWVLLNEGKDAIEEIPASRWCWQDYQEATPVKLGGFIEGIEWFDADFFGIAPREAQSMDPQQRVLLETTWHALEDAGIDPKILKGSNGAVFIGATTHEYEQLLVGAHGHDSYLATGNTSSVLSGRISYILGLQGPSLTLDTACSSALVAVHEACNALHLGETSLAIVGAVNALLSPDGYINLWQAGMLSEEGHCKVFSADADGYARAEGCAVLILKRLSDAQKDQHKILGLIKGAVVNQDGASSGLTVPNGVAQENLLRDALAKAHLQPSEIDYIEAHGTGTKLGDPMETYAISQVYKNSHGSAQPLFIGSVKAHVGHLEAAAGMAGLIKTLLCLQHEAIPAQIHLDKINPQINLEAIPGQIPQQLIPWPKKNKVRRAGVSSFGFSGTNAHIILEEAPLQDLTQIKQSLPKTVFNRQRYWAPALDEERAKEWALPSDWFFYLREEEADKVSTKEALDFQRCALLIQADEASLEYGLFIETLKNFFKAQGKECAALTYSELADYAAQSKEPMCVLDIASYMPFISQLTPQMDTIEALLQLYQELISEASHIVRWVIVGSAAEAHHLGQQILLNLAQVLNWECEFAVSYVRLADFTTSEVQALAEETLYGDEPQVKYALGKRYVTRLEKADSLVFLNRSQPLALTEGTYLITGGLGGLGFQLMQELLALGSKKIALLSRHEMSMEQAEKLQEMLSAYSAQVKHYAVDVSDREALREVITVQDNLRGVFHLAGSTYNVAFGEYTNEQMDEVLRPKVAGAWNLHELTQGLALQYFVLFSSITSLLGSNRQAPYVLASGYLDALADYRKAHGLPITHIQWGPWAEAGMATKDVRYAKMQEGFIPLDKGMHLCTQLLAIPQLTGLGVVSPKYLQFMLSFNKHLPIWLEPYIQEMKGRVPTSTKSDFLQSYYQTAKTQRYQLVEALMEHELKEVLRLTAAQGVDHEQGFFELGMDSLMAVELYERIRLALGDHIPLRPMLVFDYPTLTKLSTYLYETLEGTSPVISISGAQYENEPIAIIGMECRFPAGSDVEHFWESLTVGKNAIHYPEAFRWDVDEYPYSAGFIEGIDQFDAEFFGISPREAELLDPQQRLLLETTWHALETSGIAPASLNESETGVFIGISQSEYGQLLAEYAVESDFYQATGNALNVAAGRLAYTLGLQGPTMAIDTACSSSLVALHEACRSLQNHDCDLAIAGGVNTLLEPRNFAVLMQGQMLSPDGWCKTFDASADGYGRGEGCGVVILKRLGEAQRDNDRILAVIKGSAVNQDGASSGLTVPNGLAQEKVLAKALANANVAPQTVDYIEAHGTGTRLGDPIEVGALQTIYSPGRERILTIGTVKTNIGHLESASGIAGVIKTILAMQHEEIPRHLHFKELNPAIHLDAIPAQIPLTVVAWKREAERVRRAGISSFGFSGTNAHVILEEAPLQDLTQVKQALPKTIFNRQRYWPEVLLHKVKRGLFGEEIQRESIQTCCYESIWQEYFPQLQTAPIENTVTYDARHHAEKISMESATGLLLFLQRILKENSDVAQIIIITQQAYSVAQEPVNLNQCLLTGFIKTVILEHPELHIRHVDIEEDTGIASALEAVQKDVSDEPILVHRADRWYVPRVVYATGLFVPESDSHLQFDANASYLITGGLGGIGLELARYLRDRGAGRIVLSGRHGIEERILQTLQGSNTHIEIQLSDVSDKQQVKKLIKASHTPAYPLKGIFHLAGVVEDAPLEQQSEEYFKNVFSAKALGAWYLHEVTQAEKIELDYFELFSSAASVNGSPGQSNYATANSFLDGLAHWRQQQGLCAQSINWGPWREVGMAKDLIARHERLGVKPFKTLD